MVAAAMAATATATAAVAAGKERKGKGKKRGLRTGLRPQRQRLRMQQLCLREKGGRKVVRWKGLRLWQRQRRRQWQLRLGKKKKE